MAEDIVYSTLCGLAGADRASLESLVDMARLWAAHLREPGQFTGRILLLTNVPDLPAIKGVEFVAAPFAADDRRKLFIERVRRYSHVPARPGSRVMQLDLDALAVAPLGPLLAQCHPGRLTAARSGWSPLVPAHAGGLLSRAERWRCRSLGWSWRAGVSASVTICSGEDWTWIMRRWAASFRARRRAQPPPLGDQSYLNWLFVTGAVPMRRLEPRWVRHLRRAGRPAADPQLRGATILHFPIPDKLSEMRRLSRL